MSLLEEINSFKPQRMCIFGRWVQTASEQDIEDLTIAFQDQSIKGKWIADALASRCPGTIVDAIRDHRRGDCKICPPELLNRG